MEKAKPESPLIQYRWAGIIAVALLIFGGYFLVSRLFTGSIRVDAALEGIEHKGEPLSLDAYRQWRALPSYDLAQQVRLRNAIDAAQMNVNPRDIPFYAVLDETGNPVLTGAGPLRDTLFQWVEGSREKLSALRDLLLSEQTLQLSLQDDPDLFGETRRAHQGLLYLAIWLHANGRFEEAIDTWNASQALLRCLAYEPGTAHQMAVFFCLSESVRALEIVAASIEHEVALMEVQENLAYWEIHDMLYSGLVAARARRIDIRPRGVMILSPFQESPVGFLNGYGQLLECARQPFPTALESLEAYCRSGQLSWLRNALIWSYDESPLFEEAQYALAHLECARYAFSHALGEEQREPPTDPYTGNVLRSAETPYGFVVYSTGKDGAFETMEPAREVPGAILAGDDIGFLLRYAGPGAQGVHE